MPQASNYNGRAFEYITLHTFQEEIQKKCAVIIDESEGYNAARKAWEVISPQTRISLKNSAVVAVNIVLELEPLILKDKKHTLSLRIQTDASGKEGDVRDLIIERPKLQWEIGLSLKHNHKAVKHSRLAKTLDFGKSWYNIPCSNEYWAAVKPVFDRLELEKGKRTKWREILNKADTVYLPLLDAFTQEIQRASTKKPRKMPELLTLYLLGIYDYYKVQTKDSRKLVNLKAFNLHGTLGLVDLTTKQSKIKVLSLPNRIIHVGMKPNSKTTVEMCLNNGWSFSFRLHSASTQVEPSLKFDINLIGHPNETLSITRTWLD